MTRSQSDQPTHALDAAALAEIAFASKREQSQLSRSLAWTDPEDLGIDLSDPTQRRFGDYELLELIGRGGMGAVYRAHQHGLDRDVAIKFLAAGPWASDEFIARFRREARAAARMQHPNIVEIHDTGERDGLYWFSMRLVSGPTLAERLKQSGSLPPREAAALLRTVAEAIDYAHRLGVLHLDLKPGNILLGPNGEPLVADFGLARRIDQGPQADEDIAGTPSYMAPEQAQAKSHPIGPAADIYGLGVILYELLSGHPPFLGDNARSTLEQVIREEPRPLLQVASDVPADLAAICERCLGKDPAQRYASARQLAEDLGRFIEGHAVSVRRLNALDRMIRWARREPRTAFASAAAFVFLAVGFSVASLQWLRAEAALRDAEEQRTLAEARADRVRQAASMMADMIAANGRLQGRDTGQVERQTEAAISWLERSLPGDDQAQAELLQVFSQALIDEGKDDAAIALLFEIHKRLGEAYRRQVIDALLAKGGAENLRFAAIVAQNLETAAERDLANELLVRAATESPQDAWTAFVRAYVCEHDDEAPPCGDALERLTELEPDNALSWILASKAAPTDPQRLRAWLREAARAPRFDDYFGRFIAEHREALLRSGVPVPATLTAPFSALGFDEDDELATGWIAGMALPIASYNILADFCHPQRSTFSDAEMRDDCIALWKAGVASRGGLVANAMGWNMLRRLLPDTATADEMLNLRRRYTWMSEQLNDMGYRPGLPAARPYPFPLQMADYIAHGEFEGLLRKLEFYNVPRDPPSDWQPRNPTALMLSEDRDAYWAQHDAAAQDTATR